MATRPDDLSPEALDFLTVRHLATLTTLRPDGRPHVTPVGFTWDPATATDSLTWTRLAVMARDPRRCDIEGAWFVLRRLRV